MTRLTAVPRPLRIGAAVTGVLGAVALAGCASPATTTTATAAPSQSSGGSSSGSSTSGDYTDGTYTGTGSYQTPAGSVETVEVTVQLAGDVVTSVEVAGDPQARESQQYQAQFIGGIADVVVGTDIDELSVSRVAGSSLTSGGFNAAIDEIKTHAAS